MTRKSDETSKNGKYTSCLKWIGSPSFYLLCNFLLSQWGDWMWQFSAGLYLVHLSNGKLRLAAIFGFTGGVCVLLFGGVIGDWVDRNGRLKVVRISLFIQNISVALSALVICIVLALEPADAGQKFGILGRYFMEAAIVLLAVIAQLASVAYKIAIEKDWIVVIAAGKSSLLSNLNAVTRSLDLTCKILAPLSVGFVMSYSSMFLSAVIISAWNVVSVFIEYALLSRIYYKVPQLAFKGGVQSEKETSKEMTEIQGLNFVDEGNIALKDGRMEVKETTPDVEGDKLMIERIQNGDKKDKLDVEEATKSERNCMWKLFEPFVILFSGWRTYARQPVVFAGISLACLYMTVLGFDSITLGYIYANDITQFLVGVCMALAGVTGIIGAFTFTRMAKRFGLERTGVFAFLAELLCLVLAVASVWTPGSKFDPYKAFSQDDSMEISLNTPFVAPSYNDTIASFLTTNSWNETDLTTAMQVLPTFNISMILLLVGIIASRVGLWMADLVVTQIMQESIAENERGVVNGVQNSLNMFMDMSKFILVIFLPQIEIFGLHILLSFTFIAFGAVFFCYHALRSRKIGKIKKNEAFNDILQECVA